MENMTYNDLSVEDREFAEAMKTIRQTNRAGYLSVLCMMAAGLSRPLSEFPALLKELSDASKGEFKRAIRVIRQIQSEHSDPEYLDRVVEYIRREWLGQKVSVA